MTTSKEIRLGKEGEHLVHSLGKHCLMFDLHEYFHFVPSHLNPHEYGWVEDVQPALILLQTMGLLTKAGIVLSLTVNFGGSV